jgi:hypothetical protein
MARIDPMTGLLRNLSAPPDQMVGNAAFGGQFAAPARTSYAPPDQIVGNSAYGGQFQSPGTLGGTGGGSGGGGGGGGATPFQLPDFAALINSDPGYIQMKADLAGQGIADAAQRTAATQRGVIQFGQAPQDFSQNELSQIDPNYGTDVTPATLAAAQGNTFSTQARMQLAHTQALQGLQNSLAARGLLHSGEMNYQTQKEQQNFQTGQYDARQKLLDFLGGVQGSYATGVQQRQAQAAQAAQAAMQNQLQLYLAQLQYGGTQGSTSPAAPAAPVAQAAAPPLPIPSTSGSYGGPGVGSYGGPVGARAALAALPQQHYGGF